MTLFYLNKICPFSNQTISFLFFIIITYNVFSFVSYYARTHAQTEIERKITTLVFLVFTAHNINLFFTSLQVSIRVTLEYFPENLLLVLHWLIIWVYLVNGITPLNSFPGMYLWEEPPKESLFWGGHNFVNFQSLVPPWVYVYVLT